MSLCESRSDATLHLLNEEPLPVVSHTTPQGLSPHPRVNVSALATGGKVLATTQLAVSSEPVCVEALEAVALSSVSITSETEPRGNGRWRVRLTPQQVSAA